MADRAATERLCQEVGEILANRVCPPGVGFALILFTFEPGWSTYVANAKREDMIREAPRRGRPARAGARVIDRVKTTPVELNLIEQGWLLIAVWDRAKAGDPYARSIYLKLKSAAVAAGVEWYYGDPWPLESGSTGG